MKKIICLLLISISMAPAREPRAKNVILFLGDAGGIPTLNAASLYGHNRPQALFIQQMPQIALSDTSCLNRWVTDSAAGMTAIVTGRKIYERMVSALPEGDTLRPLKTILEYAEERGLSTGVVTNMPFWDATPAACFAHTAERSMIGEIFKQLLHPRFGDGPEVIIGCDWNRIIAEAGKLGIDAPQGLAAANYHYYERPDAISADATRVASIYNGDDFEPQPVIDNVLQILGRNRKGFFLMVEWDMHTANLEKGLKRALVMDNLIRHVAGKVPPDTLIVFAADHSFDIRLVGGNMEKTVAEQLLLAPPGQKPSSPVFRVNDSHSGEEILVAAQGPGATRLHGFIPNTGIFHVMMDAYGWKESP